MNLTTRERAGLKARAHALEPVVHRVGKVLILWRPHPVEVV